MDISLSGNPRTAMVQTGAASALPAAEGAPMRGTPPQAPNLTVTETPAPTGTGGIPPAEIDKAISRADGIGKLVNKALGGVPTAKTGKLIAEMMQKEHETAKATIDNMMPPEREIEMRKEAVKREAQKADERRAEEVAAEQLRAQLTAGLLPGEKGLVRDELDRITVRV